MLLLVPLSLHPLTLCIAGRRCHAAAHSELNLRPFEVLKADFIVCFSYQGSPDKSGIRNRPQGPTSRPNGRPRVNFDGFGYLSGCHVCCTFFFRCCFFFFLTLSEISNVRTSQNQSLVQLISHRFFIYFLDTLLDQLFNQSTFSKNYQLGAQPRFPKRPCGDPRLRQA